MELTTALRLDDLSVEKSPVDKTGDKPAIRIGIVGCGSRGLTVLERLCALAEQNQRRIEISVFDPHRPGPGLHSVEQPEYLMLNTVASQISMFPDQAALGGFSGRQGPNFYEWCLRFKPARVVQPNEFLPRQWLGEYLAWTYEEVIKALPEQMRVTHVAKAVDNIEHTDWGGYVLSTAGGHRHAVDWLLLTVGHAQAPGYVEKRVDACVGSFAGGTRRLQAYPQPFCLRDISSTDRVGIEGLGLSAMDAIAGLTVGRAGRFERGPDGLRYIPSGEEPQVFMYSRSGLPYRTRPDITPHRMGSSALIFTLSAVSDLRAQNPQGLDFESQVLPLIKAEMYTEYFGMVAEQAGESALKIKSQMMTAFLLGDLPAKVEELAQRFMAPILPESLFNPGALQPPVENYPQWMRRCIEADLLESQAGLDHCPVKAAAEVWRSCREQLRRVVDNKGLTAHSHRVFFDQYAPLVNRLVAGPQKERHQELLALEAAGVMMWVHGSHVMHNAHTGQISIVDKESRPTALDAVVAAHVTRPDETALPTIIRQLKFSGIIHSLHGRGQGISVDGEGKAQPNLWITGPIAEGATYYNHYVPSSGSYSRAFVDADRIAREMLGICVSVL